MNETIMNNESLLERIKTYFQHKQRRRVSRPYTLLIFGSLFLLIPIFNYISIAYYNDIPYLNPKLVLKTLKKLEVVLLLSSVIVGIGLLSVRRWGWYSFLVYAFALISYNLFIIILNPVIYNVGAFVQTIIAFVAIAYFLKKDISAPYFKMYPRGWRFEKRHPIEVDIKVNGKPLKTKDFSMSGFYADFENCPYQPEDSVQVVFTFEGKEYTMTAGVARVDYSEDNDQLPIGAGFAFRGLTINSKRVLSHVTKGK
jgi:hypothetical protein